MTAAAFDPNLLNSLFDNQKKLDDLFDAIFDDDNVFASNVASSLSLASSGYASDPAPSRQHYPGRDTTLTIKPRHPGFLVLPIVLEVALIYAVIAYLM